MLNYFKSFFSKDRTAYIMLTLFSTLLFVYPIPHTISIRYIIIIVLFLLSIFYYKKYSDISYNFKKTYIFIPTIMFISLIIWSAFVALFSNYSIEALNQIRSQLIMPLLIGFIAYVIASSNHKLFTPEKILTIIFFTIFIHVAYSNLESLKHFLDHKTLLRRSPAMIGLDRLNFATSFLLAILTVEIFFRVNKLKTYLPFDNFSTYMIAIFVFFGFSVVQAKRLGITSVLFLLISFTLLMIFEHRKKFTLSKTKIILLLLLIGSIFSFTIYNSFKNDKRWLTLIDTFPIAMATEKYDAWRGLEKAELLPSLPNGQKVNGSNYMRIAWITKSMKLIAENPFGYGFSKRAFRNVLEDKYPGEKIRVIQAHSGLADLGLGSGIIGILLWFSCIGYIMFISVKVFYKKKNYFALLSLFISTGFCFRMFVDSIFRDQNLQTLVIVLVSSLIFMQRNSKEIKLEK